MALSTAWATGAAVTNALASAATRTQSNSAFIRELWSDEIVATYKANLVMPNLVVTMNHNKKKGDTVHVPRPVRGVASAKAVEGQVTLVATQATSSVFDIDQHWEYSYLIEDITELQADDSLRRFITDDAGYALATRVDTDLHALGALLAGASATPTVEDTAYGSAVIGDGTTPWNPAASASEGNASVLTDAGIRNVIQALDDSDVPSRERVLVVPPVEKNNLLGIERFTEQAFVGDVGGSNSIRNGRVGDVYGIEVFVSSNCAVVEDDGANSNERAALLFQKEAMLLIEQMTPRSQTQYKQEYLGDLFTADILYGTGVLRPEAGTAIIVPA